MRIPVLVYQTEFHHRVVPVDIAVNIHHFIVLEVFLNIILQNHKCIREVHFQRTWIIIIGFHTIMLTGYQRMRAEAQVNPLPKAAKQITSFSFILPSAQASLSAIGIEAAVVLP